MDSRPRPEPVLYVCGGCGEENRLNLIPGEQISCHCGYGVLYKKRPRKIVQVEAR